ncbi:MAG: hypothetical protein PHW75_03075 [Patescibacteria group bacterium]|nr:hypothetical protein [Patescibacteria group bacterium]
MLKRNNFKFYSTYLLGKEAERRDMKVQEVFKGSGKSLIEITNKKGQTFLLIGQKLGNVPHSAYFICSNKELTKNVLQKSSINVPKGVVFINKNKKDANRYTQTVKFPIVVKPLKGTWGRDVYSNVQSLKQAQKIIEYFIGQDRDFLIEERCEGDEYRILSTNKDLLGVINRIPANIVGDGKNSIKKLIIKKNKDPRRGVAHEKSLVKIKIDESVRQFLATTGLNLDSVPKKGETVFLRSNSNLSTGGDSVDVTDSIHPNYYKLAPKIIKAIPGLLYGGIDLITSDIKEDPLKIGYFVIEINESPMISMHHEPFIGKKRNVAKGIIDLIS